MADWDVFARITKAGRKARAAMASAIDGGDLDEGQFARLLDQVVQSAGGIPTAELARKVLAAAALARESPDPDQANHSFVGAKTSIGWRRVRLARRFST